MPSHPERVRTASLPEGYQFGDAARVGRSGALFIFDDETAADLFDLASARIASGKPFDREYLDSPERQRLLAAKRFTSDRDLGDER